MTQNSCECTKPEIVVVPVHGLSLALDKTALGGGTGPSVPGIDYSLEEQWTGKLWLDGKKVYQKTMACGALPNTKMVQIPMGIENIDNVIAFEGVAWGNGQVITLPRPATKLESVVDCIIDSGGTTIRISTNSNFSALNESYITVQYTCTDR